MVLTARGCDPGATAAAPAQRRLGIAALALVGTPAAPWNLGSCSLRVAQARSTDVLSRSRPTRPEQRVAAGAGLLAGGAILLDESWRLPSLHRRGQLPADA